MPDWKLKAKLARNTIFEENYGKTFAHLWSKQQKVTILEVFTLISQSLNHILSNNIAFVFLKDWKLKINITNSIFEPFGGQNVGPGWVKNDKKGYFRTSPLTVNPVFTKKEVLKSNSLLKH